MENTNIVIENKSIDNKDLYSPKYLPNVKIIENINTYSIKLIEK